jgi:DNA polymerase-3 subunit gamma/tau
MLEYVQQLCAEEGVEVAPGVLPLVVRAGGGSPRDTLSLLDQLIAGSEGTTIDYERAVALLGYTHGALLDEVVDAIGAKDAAGAFAAADRVVQTGQDPRRFVEDLLERLRDLIVVAASSPEAAKAVLRGVPDDELARMAAQATAFGPAELSRVADLVNQTLTEMTGATSPRLHLELMLARVLVPSSDDTERGALARVERLERRVGVTDAATDGATGVSEHSAAAATRVGGAAASTASSQASAAAATTAASTTSSDRGPAASEAAAPATADAAPVAPAAPATRPKPVGPVTLQQMRDAWPEVLAALQRTKRSAWMVAFTAQVREFRDDDVLVLAFPSEQDVAGFRGGAPGQSVSELLRAAIAEVLGVTVKFIAKVDGPGGRGATAPPAAGAGADAAAPAGSGTGPVGSRTAPVGSGSTPAGSGTMPTGSGTAPTGSGPAPSGSGTAPADSGTASADSGTVPVGSGSAPVGSGTVPAGRASPAGSGAPGRSTASAPSARSERRASPSAATSAAGPTAPVDSWATVAIPGGDVAPDLTSAPERTSTPAAAGGRGGGTAIAVAAPPAQPTAPATSRAASRASAPAAPIDDLPDDADAPPEDVEPPFDPGPAPELVVEASERPPVTRGGSGSAPAEGIQRYGEAVVREVLGATFLEEVEAPGRPGFGERG